MKRVTRKDFRVTLTDRRSGDPAILVGSSKKARENLKWDPQYADIDIIVEHAWLWHEKRYF